MGSVYEGSNVLQLKESLSFKRGSGERELGRGRHFIDRVAPPEPESVSIILKKGSLNMIMEP